MTLSLEGFLNEGLSGTKRGFGDTFRKAVKALKTADVGFAVAGSIAYSAQIEPTYTRDIDLLTDPGAARRAWLALQHAGFKLEGDSTLARATDANGVWLDLMFGVGDPEESARVTAKPQTLLRVLVPVVDPGYMLWMYLLSPHGRHRDRALEIVRRKAADLSWLSGALRHDNDLEALAKLKHYVAEAKLPAATWKPRRKP